MTEAMHAQITREPKPRSPVRPMRRAAAEMDADGNPDPEAFEMHTTNRHRIAATLFVLAFAGAGTGLAVADSDEAQERLSATMVVKNRIVKMSTVDVPPLIRSRRSPETPGDQAIFVSKLSGDRSGRRYLHCTVVRQGKSYATALLSCDATYVLSDGSITAAGVAAIDNGKPVEGAITGGTGAYPGARGVVSSAPDGTDTLTLE